MLEDDIYYPEDMKKKKINIIPPTSNYILPSNNTDLQSFSQQYKIDMMEQVINCIELAIKNKFPHVEVFQFKNSEFVITLSENDYLANLNNIYNYYMRNESYEYCFRVVQLQNILKKNSINNTDEKQKC